MIKRIHKHNSPILHKRINPTAIKSQCTRLNKIHTDLLDTITTHPNCLGLAANQIGYYARMFVMKYGSEFILVVNPAITKTRGEKIDYEECMSFPGKRVKVSRYTQIEARFNNASGDIIRIKFSKLDARVFQHELDHLNGVSIIDFL